jgi:DNA mismatch endonuclease, patch repair protein
VADAGPVFHVPPHPGASSQAVSHRMSRLPRRDNEAEAAVRRLLFAGGLRYRVALPVPGRPRRSIDIAFPFVKVAAFIDGCFWHACPEHGNRPHSNSAWWEAKLTANAARDRDTTEHLESLGWCVVRIWEHEPPSDAAVRIAEAVDTARSQQVPGAARAGRVPLTS